MAENKLIAIVRVRGLTGLNPKQKATLLMLNLKRSNQATLVHTNESYNGMLEQSKDYITWGPISKPILLNMLTKRAFVGKSKLSTTKSESDIEKICDELIGGKSLKDLQINRNFRLTPPSKGWKAKKVRYPQGDLGPRDSIDKLLTRMI